jgi:hypothetical protein
MKQQPSLPSSSETLRVKDVPHNSLKISAEASDPKNLALRDRLDIRFSYSKGGRLKVHLMIPLDPNVPAEARAETLNIYTYQAGRKYLDVLYDLDINLETEMQALSESIEDLYQTTTGQVLRQADLVKLTDAQLAEVLSALAGPGRNLFHKLFVAIDINFSGDARDIVMEAIRSAFSRPQIIQIDSPDPLYPWVLLYNHPTFDADNPAPEGFWGFKHEIQEQYNCTAQTRYLPPDYRLLAAICKVMDNQGWHQQPDHPFTLMSDHVSRSPTKEELGQALGDFNWDCLYFFGHASHSNPASAATSWVKLITKNLTVAEMEIDYQAPKFKNKLVVTFLNGCHTAPLNRWDGSTVVGYLCENGEKKVCCVATVNSLPAALAAQFAKYFWKFFLCDTQPIGSSLLNARKEILTRWNNPLGLLYSLFGRVDTQVQARLALDPIPTADQTLPQEGQTGV